MVIRTEMNQYLGSYLAYNLHVQVQLVVMVSIVLCGRLSSSSDPLCLDSLRDDSFRIA